MHQHQYGLGMAELLIGLFLSSFTMMLMMNHYLNTKKHYHHLQQSLEKNMDLLLIADLMRESIRKSGFTPCSVIDQLTTHDEADANQHLKGVTISLNSMQLVRMNERFNLVTKMNHSSSLYATNDEAFKKNQTVLIADCYHAEVKKISEVTPAGKYQMVSFTSPLSYQYHKPIYLGEWVDEVFYIHSSSLNRTSLFYKFQHAEELMSNVQNLIAHVDEVRGRALVSVRLELTKANSFEFSTMVRAN